MCRYKHDFIETAGILPLSRNTNAILLRQHNIHKGQLIRLITCLQLCQAVHTVYMKLQTVLFKQRLHLHLNKL